MHKTGTFMFNLKERFFVLNPEEGFLFILNMLDENFISKIKKALLSDIKDRKIIL
jgi:hypothetical protein